MDLIETMPVTIVVKAPSQKIGDQIIQCGMEWTVQKLKEHLSDVYPNNPKANQQKIIYSGKLLTDNLKLKDVLKQYHPDQTAHTIHLVCAANNGSASSSPKPSTSSVTASPSAPSSEGLRQRQTAHQRQSTATENSTPAPAAVPPTDMGAALPTQAEEENVVYGEGGPVPVMMPGHYSHEMAMMMQHLYAQQMAHYMQFYQNHPAFQHMYQYQTPMDSAPQPPHEAPPAAERPPAPQRQDNQVRMNAQGGAMMDDDEEENMNRDWLDWVYTLSRFSVLLSIVFYYSSFPRFVMVLFFGVLIYLYQAGWLRLQRREVRLPPQDVRAAQPEPTPEPQQQPNQPPQQSPESESETSSSDEEQEAEPVPQGPGVLGLTLSFVVNFFTSLIPQQPEAVNVN